MHNKYYMCVMAYMYDISFHFRKEFLSNLPNIFIFAIGVK